ncbi:hypothetical protein VNO77_18636 [Canavalia gladiata]|uniref:Uncharacterized protein n=1 Tax=Canavalia gladiata TaxID=3824 RepID=A0AAN9LL70_CANGL
MNSMREKQRVRLLSPLSFIYVDPSKGLDSAFEMVRTGNERMESLSLTLKIILNSDDQMYLLSTQILTLIYTILYYIPLRLIFPKANPVSISHSAPLSYLSLISPELSTTYVAHTLPCSALLHSHPFDIVHGA